MGGVAGACSRCGMGGGVWLLECSMQEGEDLKNGWAQLTKPWL